MYLNQRLFVLYLYPLVVSIFVIFLKLLEYVNYLSSIGTTELNYPTYTFDYIVVGSGTAGAVLANRLAENKSHHVLILESGKYGTPLLDIPSLALLVQSSSFNWQYETVPQENSCLGLHNNASKWPMGRIMGGTGMLNNMIHVRGHPEDFRGWFKDKEKFDFYRDIEPYFVKSEKGSTYVTSPSFISLLPEYFLDAVSSLGFSVNIDTTVCDKGFAEPKLNLFNGKRWTPAHNLMSNSKENLFIRTDRDVTKVLLHDNFEAYGVEYAYNDKIYEARATKGIILAAGVIGSPKILMHSGIGPKKHLNDMNVDTKIDLPVGENLQDHLATGFDLIVLNQSLGIGLENMFSPLAAFDYFWNGKGPWTTGGCEVLGFVNTNTPIDRQDNSIQPDLQFMIMPLGMNEDRGMYLRHLTGITADTWQNYFALLNDSVTISALPVLLHPKSRGYMLLRDNNFKSKPLINPRYLTHHHDVDVLIEGINLIKKIVNTKAMRKLGAKFNSNIYPGCKHLPYDSRDYWECYLRHMTITSYHPIGTCKMGDEIDKSAVVNFNFEVKNTNNLFVVDGSVMPTLTSGNINSAIMMMAEMASDLIKLRNYMNEGSCAVKEIFVHRNVC